MRTINLLKSLLKDFESIKEGSCMNIYALQLINIDIDLINEEIKLLEKNLSDSKKLGDNWILKS